MDISKTVKIICADKDIKTYQIADALGLAPITIYNKLSKGRMTLKACDEIAEALGCRIVLQDKETGKIYD